LEPSVAVALGIPSFGIGGSDTTCHPLPIKLQQITGGLRKNAGEGVRKLVFNLPIFWLSISFYSE
jgi:hypothetical protein